MTCEVLIKMIRSNLMRALKVRISQGKQYVPDVRNAKTVGFRGLPQISSTPCEAECTACLTACPTNAITLDPVRIDLGRCIFCSDCSAVCPVDKFQYTENYKMASHSREGLLVGEGVHSIQIQVANEIKKVFGRSLRLRSVSAGGCNACELEVNALSNVNFDIARFGIDFVSSPRHADGLVLTGPITQNMSEALSLAYEGMPDPKFIIAVGACAISGGIFDGSSALDRTFLERFKPGLYVPGCPPHPLTFLNGILDLLGRK